MTDARCSSDDRLFVCRLPFYRGYTMHAGVSFLCVLLFLSCVRPVFGEEALEDTAGNKRAGFLAYPFMFYTPETGFAGGGTAGRYFREPGSAVNSRPSLTMLTLIYTQKRQIIAGILGDLYWGDEAYNAAASLGYVKFPSSFYGIGNNTREEDEEEYTSESISVELRGHRRIRPGLNAGVLYRWTHRELIEVEDGGLLAEGGVPGSEGGVVSGGGLFVNWDTRSNLYYPTSGSFVQVSLDRFDGAVGSDYEFGVLTADIRRYLALSSDHILALQAYYSDIEGDPPFRMLSLLGGRRLMRGYYEGRYRDKKMAAVQGEYRLPLGRQFVLAGFLGFGDVAETRSDFALGDVKCSVGGGIRYRLNPEEGINLRFDVGLGKGTSGIYVDMFEAF